MPSSQTSCLVFLAVGGWFHVDLCAPFSIANSPVDASGQQLNSSEPDAERGSDDSPMNDPDDHVDSGEEEGNDAGEDGDDPGDEEPPGEDPSEQYEPSDDDDAPREYWIVYRANPYNRLQMSYCYTQTNVDNVAARFQRALQRCWPVRSYNTPPLRFVHASALLSLSARGAQQVGIVEYSQDGRQFLGMHRTILVEVLVLFQSHWMHAVTKAIYTERRGNFFQVLRMVHEIVDCQQPDVICYGFQNGIYKPLRSMISVSNGDFLQVQILREDPPHPAARQYLDESPSPSICSACSDSAVSEKTASKVLALRAYTFRGPGSAATTFYEEPLDDYPQYETILERVWRDLSAVDWQIVQVDDAFKSSTYLSRWDKVYLIDHERERHPGYSFVLFETNDPALISQGKRLRAAWIVPVVSREMVITLMEEQGRCSADGTECFMVHNGRPVTRGEVLHLRHGDYVFLDVSTEEATIGTSQAIAPYRKPHGGGEWTRGHYFLIILGVDGIAALMTFVCLLLCTKPCQRRFRLVGRRRHSVRCIHKRKAPRPSLILLWSFCLISADAMPMLQHVLRQPFAHSLVDNVLPAQSRQQYLVDHSSLRLLSGNPGEICSTAPVLSEDHFECGCLLSGYPDDHTCFDQGPVGEDDGSRSLTSLLSGYPGGCLRRSPVITAYQPCDVIGCKHDGEDTVNPSLVPVSLTTDPVERQAMRQPRMTFANDPQLHDVVAQYAEVEMGRVVLETFGLYDQSIGNRATTTESISFTMIRRAIHAAWIDYTAHYDSRILVVTPQPPHQQPPVRIFFIVQIVDAGLHLPATWKPVLVEQQAESVSGATATMVRSATYLNAPTNIENVFAAARVGNSCLPNGIRPCAVTWRSREWTYPSILQPLEGDYLIVRVDNLERYFRGTAGYFPGARRFALEGQRVYAQLSSGNYLSLWIHAIGHAFEPLGHRDAVLQMPDLLQPERVWTMAQHVWRDKNPGRAARLIPATPQPSLGSRGRLRLHLIFAFKVRPDHHPTLYVAMLNSDVVYYSQAQELQWVAVYTPVESSAPTMLTSSTLDYFRTVTRANYEILHGDDVVPTNEIMTITSGAFFIVNFHLQTWMTLASSMWETLHAQHLASRSTNLLQLKVTLNRGSTWFINGSTQKAISNAAPFHSTFGNLPPPGNGAIVDLRRYLTALDDCCSHEWGDIVFDFNGGEVPSGPLASVTIDLPDLNQLLDQIFTATIYSFPLRLLTDNLDKFDVSLHPFLLNLVREDCGAQIQDTPLLCQIYTDGSYDSTSDSPVGWGFAAFYCGNDGVVLEHMACGFIDEFCPVLHGHPVGLSARTGEIEAMIQATLWSISSMLCLPITMYFDAVSVGYSAGGVWNHKPDDIHMRILRALTQFAEIHHEQGFHGEHVFAHTGILGNEVANFLANYARQNRYSCGGTSSNLAPFTGGERMPLEWLWLRLVPSTESEQSFPTITAHRVVADCSPPLVSSNEAFPQLLRPEQVMEERRKEICFGLASYNVGSLLKPTNGRPDGMAPQEYLRRQAQAHGLSCLMLQETRARQSGMIESTTHLRLIAEAANGQGGTEIWIAKLDDKERKTGVSAKDVLVLAAEPQLLLARVHWPFGKFLVLSAHGPHQGRPKEVIQEWWHCVSDLVKKHHNPDKEWLLCGIDANAHFDEACDPWIGDHGLEQTTNYPGTCFLEFLQRLDLCLPSTFDFNHQGPTTTWRNSKPDEACRCDYLCVPVTWRPSHLESFNLPTLDAGTSSFDHVPISLWCKIIFVSKRNPRPSFDRDAIQQTYGQHGHHLCESLQSIPWHLDVHRHGSLVSEKTRQWLETYCPKKVSKPRATYIRDSTWQLRKHRLWLARTFRNLGQLLLTNRLQAAFVAWKMDRPLWEVLECCFDLTCGIHKTLRQIRHLLRTTRNLLRSSIRADRTIFLEEVATDAISDHPNALHSHLRRAGVQSKSKRPLLQPLPCLNDLEGNLVTSFEAFAETWRKQFEIQEDGVPCTQEELYQRCLQRQSWDGSLDVPPEWHMLPTLTELERVFRQTKTRKAFFDDVVPGEVLHYAAKDFARLLYPLLLKQWLFHQEPVLFKGGLLVSAFKRGNPADTNNYRSLLISPTIAKSFHRLLRGDLMKFFEVHALPLQLGGRPGISVTQASHVLHDFLHHHRVLKIPTAVVFLDIRNAFYRLFRQRLLKCGSLERTVDDLFSSLKLPAAARLEFQQLLTGESAMEASDIPPFWQGQVRELLNATWFTVSGTPTLTEARKGSRPGDSAADLLFSIAFRHLLHMVSSRAADLGVVSYLEWSGHHVPFHNDLERTEVLEFLGPIWADDVAILLEASTSAQLIRNAQVILGLLFDQLILAGMSPNLGKSKTEIIFDLRGKDSVALRKHFALNGWRLPTISKHMAAYVNIVGAYKHLGTWVQVNGKLSKELACRFAIGHSTMSKYRSAIFGNRKLPLPRKTHLFHSLVMSAVMFNSAAWYLQRKKDVEKFHSGVMALYRRLATSHFGILVRHWRDELVQSRLSLPPPVSLLHQDRLRYLQHIVRQGDDAVWAALQQHCYWWQMVDLSLEWLKANVMTPLPDLPVSENWSSWQQLLAAPGGSWKGLLRRALRHDTLQARKASSWYDFHSQSCQLLVDNGVFELPSSVLEWDQFACLRCRQSFRTCSAWSVHAFRKHGRTTMARLVARGDVCEVCLKKFHDHAGLINHLTNNPDCFWQLRSKHGVVPAQPSLNSRVEKRQRTELRTPVHRLTGPQRPRVELTDPVPSDDQQSLMDAWETVRLWYIDSPGDVEDGRERLRVATLDTILPINEIHYVACSWQRILRLQHLIAVGDEFDGLLDRYIQGLDVKWLLRDQTQPRRNVTDPEVILATWTGMTPRFIPVDRPIKLHQIIVCHLFSGRRRPGDLQDRLEKLRFPEGHQLLTLSVDIIFNETWGNLLRPDTMQLFLRACREGLVTAMVAGPPCETWSVARLRGLYGDFGPRPLRNADQLAGFSQLSIREVQQVCVANELLGVSLILALAMWMSSGLMIVEHPAEPSHHPSAASIWRTRILHCLMALPRVVRERVHQGLFGAVSSKPTDLLVVTPPPGLTSLFRLHQTRQDIPIGGTIGKDLHGRYRTAALKEYPEGFCNALAHVVMAHVAHRGSSDQLNHCPEDVASKFNSLVGQLDQSVQEFGPDFNPAALN